MASNVQRGPRWLSLMASIPGASNGIASCRLACSSKSFSSTNKNSACESTNRWISQGHATRSTFQFLGVIHFLFASRSPRVREFDGEAILVKLWWIGRDQAGKTLAGCIDHVEVAVGTIVPSQANVCACGLRVGGVHLDQRG